MRHKPLIGVVVDHDNRPPLTGRIPTEGLYNLLQAYAEAIEAVGGIPVGLFYSNKKADAIKIIDRLDGVLFTGGNFDIDPKLYGQPMLHRVDTLKPQRTHFEMALFKAALAVDKPVLGICGGMQVMNVTLGGSLIQNIGDQIPGARNHEQKKPKNQTDHEVAANPGSLLAKAAGRLRLEVNSTHHQAVNKPGKGLEIVGMSPDGLIEALAVASRRWVLAVQWHPELLWYDDPVQKRIFSSFVKACGEGD